MDKEKLYKNIQNLRQRLNITFDDYPLNVRKIYSEQLGKKLGEVPFSISALRGMAIIDVNDPENDVILLNSFRTKIEQNFDCSHEFIHTVAHRNLPNKTSFKCFEKVTNKQDRFIEWQANEGAAELLIPYKLFIPKYVEYSRERAHDFSYIPEFELSEMFNVSTAVLSNRIDSLNYEIYQYLQHGSIDDIEILSRNKQKERGWNKNHKQWFCLKCLAAINEGAPFCSICGKELVSSRSPKLLYNYTGIGAGFMKYSGVKLNENGEFDICPNCKNEEIITGERFCKICGSPLKNECENPNCQGVNEIHPSNARYCSFCGGETSYKRMGYLKGWDAKTEDIATNSTSSLDDGEDLPF